jgi:hypothetical protein
MGSINNSKALEVGSRLSEAARAEKGASKVPLESVLIYGTLVLSAALKRAI